MRSLLLLVALAVHPGFAAGQAAVTQVALYVQFDQAPSEVVVDAIRSELDSIMGPIGLQFDWRALPANNAEPSAELAVASFKGRCDATSLPTTGSNPGALGWTYISDGVILPFSDVDCTGLRTFLGKELLMLPSGERETALGRALGRVLAHELYHIFANTKRHAVEGVGKPVYSVDDLLSQGFHFAKREAEALHFR